MNDKKFHDLIKTIVQNELKAQNLVGNWHLGVVDSVTSSKKLSVFVDGSTTAQSISCNPDVTFNVNDEVWVVFINGNPRDKFVISKRAV